MLSTSQGSQGSHRDLSLFAVIVSCFLSTDPSSVPQVSGFLIYSQKDPHFHVPKHRRNTRILYWYCLSKSQQKSLYIYFCIEAEDF